MKFNKVLKVVGCGFKYNATKDVLEVEPIELENTAKKLEKLERLEKENQSLKESVERLEIGIEASHELMYELDKKNRELNNYLKRDKAYTGLYARLDEKRREVIEKRKGKERA